MSENVPEVPAVTVDGVVTPVAELSPQVQSLLALLEDWKADLEKKKMESVKMEYAVAHLTSRVVTAVRDHRKPEEVPVPDANEVPAV